MLRSLSRLFLLIVWLPLAACSLNGVTAQQDADLRGVYEKMRANDIAGIEAQFTPQFKQASLHQGLVFMQGMIPPDAPRVTRLKAISQPGPDGATDYGAQYEYDYKFTAVLAQIEMRQDKAGRKTINSVQLRQAGGHSARLRLRPGRQEVLSVRLPVPGAAGARARRLGPIRPVAGAGHQMEVLLGPGHAAGLHGPDHGLAHRRHPADPAPDPSAVDLRPQVRAAVAVDADDLPAPGLDRLPARLPPAGAALGPAEGQEGAPSFERVAGRKTGSHFSSTRSRSPDP